MLVSTAMRSIKALTSSMALATSALLAAACSSGGAPTPGGGPTPVLAVGVHTPEAFLDKYESWPDAYKFRVNDDLVVLLAYPSDVLDFAGSVFIDHIPSASSATLAHRAASGGEAGPSWRIDTGVGPQGRRVLVAALANLGLMTRIAVRQDALASSYSSVQETAQRAILIVYVVPFGESGHSFDFYAEIIGGPDDDPELYCVGDGWDLGNIVTEHPEPCATRTVEPTITRLFKQSNSYVEKGTYVVTFTTGPLHGTTTVTVP